jgi:hypothetical protein
MILLLWFLSLSVVQGEEKLKLLCSEGNATACYAFGLPMISGENEKVQDIREEGMDYMRKACLLKEYRGCDKMGER